MTRESKVTGAALLNHKGFLTRSGLAGPPRVTGAGIPRELAHPPCAGDDSKRMRDECRVITRLLKHRVEVRSNVLFRLKVFG